MPLCCSAICASCNMHIGVSTGVNKRNVKDTFLASRHERHDVSVFGDAGATRTVAPTLHCWSAGGTISLELMRRRVVRRRGGGAADGAALGWVAAAFGSHVVGTVRDGAVVPFE